MKTIIMFLAILVSISHVNAGLFEYHLGVETSTNNTQGATDTIETIEQYQAPKVQKTYNSNYYTDSYYNSSYNRPYMESYYDNISHSSNYYSYNELKTSYERELENLEREANYIDDLKRDIKLNLSDLRKYNSQYYYDIKASLNTELDHIEDRERQVENEIDDIEDEIKDLKKNKSNSNTRYYNYYNNGSYYDSWSSSYYDGRYYDYNRGYYRYDDDTKTYLPHWINSDLEPVNGGHIYIR